ncbi:MULTISPECIES: cache domain-containing sensor histidine kinase [Caproicibacterium]|uniref:histidine kinase n=1 Tax=Caproicibacterium argilliputei TaxID=3030016 RepID=A0AA97DAA9_9FIRM|nr:sensor histidine kinase [Caproicibacterium argilliputei]WOC33206.1 sensor histidine kinase [Caproicibacterium argilliputei]
MLRFFMNRPLKTKILILSLLSSVILITVLSVFIYVVYSRNVVEEAQVYQSQNMTFVKKGIEDIQDNIVNLSTNLLYSPSFQMQISPEKDHLTVKQAADEMNTVNFLTNSIITNNYVSYLSIHAANGYQFYYARNGLTMPQEFSKTQRDAAYMDAMNMLGEPKWIATPQDGGSFLVDNNTGKLTMLRGLVDIDNRKTQGLLVVCIDWHSIWSSLSKTQGYGYFIVDGKGSVVSGSTDLAALKKYEQGGRLALPGHSDEGTIVTLDSSRYLSCSSMIYQSGLYVVCLRPMSVILKDIDHFNIVLAIAIGVSLLLSLLLAALLSTAVTTPLKQLVRAIQQAGKGDLKQQVNFVYQDEIGILGKAFNQMVTQLNTLFNRVMKLEIKNREAELKSLQAQINPHFLYNTLDSIYLKAMRAKDTGAAEMVYALSRIFRLTLNHGSSMTTVKNEKEFIESYILLQKMRLKERLAFQISIADALLPHTMLKLTLQPFVENAIVHAAEQSTGTTCISVSGTLAEGFMEFTVADNGCGITPELLQKLNSKTGGTQGYAIGNIRERLELCYGSRCRLTIQSTPGEGTAVHIRIPAEP